MARIAVWVKNELLRRLKAFAEKEHGDSNQHAQAKVVEAGLRWWLEKRSLKIVFDIECKTLPHSHGFWKRFWNNILSEGVIDDKQTNGG